MGFFNKRKREKILDLSERYRIRDIKKKKEAVQTNQAEVKGSDGNPSFNFFENFSSTIETKNEETGDVSDLSSSDEKKRRLAKRLIDMTNKMEDLSNQVYKLQQRLEVLEKKKNIDSY